MPEDSSDDSPESPFAGWPSSSSEAGVSLPYLENAFQPSSSASETVSISVKSYLPWAVLLSVLAQLLQVTFGPSALVPVLVLLGLASAAVLVTLRERSQAALEEDSGAGDEES